MKLRPHHILANLLKRLVKINYLKILPAAEVLKRYTT